MLSLRSLGYRLVITSLEGAYHFDVLMGCVKTLDERVHVFPVLTAQRVPELYRGFPFVSGRGFGFAWGYAWIAGSSPPPHAASKLNSMMTDSSVYHLDFI